MVQYVEHLPFELHRVSLAKLKTLEQSHVQLRDTRLADAVPTGVADVAKQRQRESASVEKLIHVVEVVV